MSAEPTVHTEELGGRLAGWSRRPGRGPAALLLGGCGVGSWVWPPLLDRLGERAVLVLDRPGMAGTPWPGRLPTLAEEVATLVALVERAGDGPVVPVAHSMAGPHAEAFARSRPDLVAGLVLVDASTEDPVPTPDPAAERRWSVAARTARGAMRVPPVRLLGPWVEHVMAAAQSRRIRLFTDVSPEAQAAYRDPQTVAMVVAENAAYARQLADLEALRGQRDLPEVGVRVLTAAGDGGADWVRLQQGLAARLAGEQVVLPDSRHLMMVDRPDAIAAAVDAVAPLTPA